MIVDRYHRVHNYLRISLTDNCNLRCFYCMPEEDYEFTPASRLMQLPEIESLAKTFVDLGAERGRRDERGHQSKQDCDDGFHGEAPVV